MYYRLLRKYLGPLWQRTTLLGVLLVLGVGLELLNPQIVRAFIDTAQADGALETLSGAAMLYIGVAIVGQIVAVADTYLAESVGQEATNALRADLTEHCLDLDMRFHNASIAFVVPEDNPAAVQATAAIVRRFGLDLETAIANKAPNVLIGSPSAMIEQVQERRSTFGLSYITVGVQDAETFAPVVQRLAGT